VWQTTRCKPFVTCGATTTSHYNFCNQRRGVRINENNVLHPHFPTKGALTSHRSAFRYSRWEFCAVRLSPAIASKSRRCRVVTDRPKVAHRASARILLYTENSGGTVAGRIENLRPWPKGVSGNLKGRPKEDISAEIARALFENNAEAIYTVLARLNRQGRCIGTEPSESMHFCIANSRCS
jgi:hypothetical protein